MTILPLGPQGPAGPTGPTGATGPAGPGVPTGGTANQILAKIDTTDYHTQWVNQPAGLPTGGTANQVLAKIDTTNYNTQWVTQSGGTPAGPNQCLQCNNNGAFGGVDMYNGSSGGTYTNGSIQVRGNSFGSFSGAGSELYFATATGEGGFVCYDRSLGHYLGFRIDCLYESFCNQGTEQMRLTGGQLGLGTSSPQAHFHIHGGSFVIGAASSTSAERLQARFLTAWATSTDATRTGRLQICAEDWTGTDREGVRVESDGTQPLLGFFGGAAAAQPVLSYSRSAAGETAAVAAIRTALANLGLVKDSTTA